MSKNNDNLENLMNDDEMKYTIVQYSLVLVLNTIVLVIKNSIIDGINFYWPDTLSLSVTIFTIFFMTILKKESFFSQWKERFLEPKRRNLFFFGGMFILIFLKLSSDFIATILTGITTQLSIFFSDPISLFFIDKIFFFIKLILDFFFYFSFFFFLNAYNYTDFCLSG